MGTQDSSPIFAWNAKKNEWAEAKNHPDLKALQKPLGKAQSLRLYTWNVDFAGDHARHRICEALDHLQSSISAPQSSTVILLQEVYYAALDSLLDHPLVKLNFQVTDIKASGHHYFTTTLVSTDLIVDHVERVPFQSSRMDRDVLYVDIKVQGGGVLRCANTHLESLPTGEAERPVQLGIISKLLKADRVIAGIVGGDMNAIGDVDIDLHKNKYIQLNDVWDLEMRKGRAEEEGFTWGYQPKCRFPTGRLDKILYTGPLIFEETEGKLLSRLGVGLKYKPKQQSENGRDHWVSDHFGLSVELKLE
ncbi:Endonuclease/exonuclease/phosphatase [Geopyxis carbonaria]|nr:Endonuclease/exonuclease/phosphatase [Geopyxis carbonaria]